MILYGHPFSSYTWKALIPLSKSGKQESTNYEITLESESFLLK